MAELLGTAASVIAVIQLTAAVASLSYEYISGVARAPSELQRFMNELKALTAVLSRLQMFALDNPDVADSWGLGEELRRCAEELKDVRERLEPKKGWWGAALGRFQWPMGERETLDYVWRLERLKSHFTLAMTAENRACSKVIDKNVEDIKRDLSSHTSEMKIQQLNSNRTNVLNWLYPRPYDEKHREISGRRQKNTGQWILDLQNVQDWLDPNNTGSRLLWAYGIPGAGKTFLSSFIIDHLRAQDQALVYIYFNHKEQDQQGPINVLSSFLKQLSCQSPRLPKAVRDLHNRMESKQERPTLEDLYTALILVAGSFSQTFVVCDALDECDFETQRKDLLPLFHRMENDGIRLFLTSREHPEDIQDSFQSSPKVELSAKNEDIKIYIEQKIDENPRARRLISQGNCKDKIIEQLQQSANGMFLLVSFHIKYLCQQATVKQILVELDNLSKSSNKESPMDPTYDRVIDIIRSQTPNCVELAMRVLTWIVKARSVLSVRALQLAVSVDEKCTVFEEFSLPDRKTLLDVCGGFASIDEKDRVVLVHLTVHEYLLRKSIIPEDAEFQLAMGCTTFLSYDIFSKPCESYQLKLAREKSYPFIKYAAKRLCSHVYSCNETLLADAIFRFLSSPGNIQSYLDASEVIQSDLDASSGALQRARGPAQKSRTSTGPLQLATVLGSKLVVQMLLDGGADIEHKDSSGRTCLHYSVILGCTGITAVENPDELRDSYLWSSTRGSALVTSCVQGLSPLALAILGRQEPITSLLIERGASISAVDNLGRTPLYISVWLENEPITRLLLEGGANESAICRDGDKTPRISRNPQRELTTPTKKNILVGLSTVGPKGQTPLHISVELGNRSITKLLLEKGANLEVADNLGRTPLHISSEKNENSITRLLLEEGAEATIDLVIPVRQRNKIAARLLLDKGAKTSKFGHQEIPPLHEAVWLGDIEITELLLKKGADVSETGLFGRTPLHISVSRGKEEITKILVENGAETSAADDDGQTPLHLSAEGYNSAITRLLLDNGADMSIVDHSGNTPLHLACSRKSLDRRLNNASILETVSLMLERGADVTAMDGEERTPLELTTCHNNPELAGLLGTVAVKSRGDGVGSFKCICMNNVGGEIPVLVS